MELNFSGTSYFFNHFIELSFSLYRTEVDLRNFYIAHAGISEFEKLDTRVSLDPDKQKDPQIYSTTRNAISLTQDKLKVYIKLIEKVLNYVQNQLNKKGKTIYRNDVKPHLNDWYESVNSSGK